MKNIIILGPPRCGKTTLAQMLVDKYHYQFIKVDTLRDTFNSVFPELNIAPNIAIKNEKFQVFLQEYLKRNTRRNQKYGYIMEGCETSVPDCNRLFKNDKTIIYYLGQPSIDPANLFHIIRQNETDKDWTSKLTDKEVLQCCYDIIFKSKKIKEDCLKYNIPFIDTSFNRKEILETIFKDIEKKISY